MREEIYLIDALAGVFILVFAVSLKNAFQGFEGTSATLADVVLGAGVAAAAVSLVQAGVGEALGNSAAIGNSPAIVLAFNLHNAADTFKLLALAVLSGAASILTFRTRALPQWLGWLGVLLSASLVVGGMTFILNSPALYMVVVLALLLLLIWVAAVSIIMFRRLGAEPERVRRAGEAMQ